MSNEHIVYACKDEEYRNSLIKEESTQLPENLAELIELTEKDLESVAGVLRYSQIWLWWGSKSTN